MPPYKDKRDGRWRYKFQHQGKQYSGSTTKARNTKAAAIACEKEHQERLERRIHTGHMPTLAEFAADFLEKQRGRASKLTIEGQTSHLNKHVLPLFGKMPLDRFFAEHADELTQAWLAKGIAPTTINTRLGTLQRMLNYAEERRILRAAPTLRRTATDHDVKRLQFLTDEQGAALVAAAAPQWASMMLVALRTGMRVGELRALKWADLNFETRLIRVISTDPGRPDMPETSPKSGRQRTVPMTQDAYDTLRSLERKSAWVWPALQWRGMKRDRPRSQTGCRHAIEQAGKAIGVPEIHWHMLRHTYASALVMRGVPLKVVQELLGHADSKQTEVYAHLAPGFAHHAAVAALDLPLVQRPALHLSSTSESTDPERLVLVPGADE